MKRPAFRTAHLPPPPPLNRLIAGAILAALALSAQANPGASSTTSAATTAHPSTPNSASARVRRPQPWRQVGLASWYGGQFQGRTTAAGETYDMNQLTCAHPTLPMGTWLRVTNLHNRRSTYVRVNDRGPVIDGRIVDLSYAAAHRIGLSGVGRVRLEQVRENDPALAQALVADLQMPVLFNPVGPVRR